MNILILWLVTIVVSFGIETSVILRLAKIIADSGYKLNIKRIENLDNLIENQKEIDKEQSQMNGLKNIDISPKITSFIPIYNVLSAMQMAIEIRDEEDELLNYVNELDGIEEMSAYEKQEYAKHPTGFRSIFNAVTMEKRLEKARKIEVNYNNEKCDVFYEIDKNNKNYVVLKSTGSFSKLPLEEQNKLAQETVIKQLEGIDIFGAVKDLFNDKYNKTNNNQFKTIQNCLNDTNEVIEDKPKVKSMKKKR